jgi:hypothetical protein
LNLWWTHQTIHSSPSTTPSIFSELLQHSSAYHSISNHHLAAQNFYFRNPKNFSNPTQRNNRIDLHLLNKLHGWIQQEKQNEEEGNRHRRNWHSVQQQTSDRWTAFLSLISSTT